MGASLGGEVARLATVERVERGVVHGELGGRFRDRDGGAGCFDEDTGSIFHGLGLDADVGYPVQQNA